MAGELWAVGYGGSGVLGQGNTSNLSTLTQIGTATNWSKLSAAPGGESVLAVRADGTLWAWGKSDYGNLGLGDYTQRNAPVQVGTDTDWADVYASDNWTIAKKTTGALYGCGRNDLYQLGLNDTTQRTTFVQIGSATDWSTVSANGNRALALKTGGTLWAWGHNGNGQVGNGGTTTQQVPVQIGSATDWVDIAAGYYHSFGIRDNAGSRTLWGWGSGSNGRLGVVADYTAPTQIGTDTNWQKMYASTANSLGLKTNGTLYGTGANANAELGGYTTGTVWAFTQEATAATTWAGVSMGATHTHATRTDGTIWACGDNSYTKQGKSGSSPTYTLAQVGSGTDWESAKGTTNSSLLMLTVVPPVTSASAPITITVGHRSGAANAPLKINVRQSGTASAPLRISVVDSLATTSWSVAVTLAGADVSARLTGQISVDAEEGASRIAAFTLLPVAGSINPVAWTGSAVGIDLLRVIGGVSVAARLFTGNVDLASYDPQTRLVAFTCTDDIKHIVAALTVAQVDALAGGLYSRGAQGEIDDRWDYAQARMDSRQASLDAGPHGNLRVTDWAWLTTWRTFTAADVADNSLQIELPRRQDMINSVEIAYEYRYHRLRERWASVAWSGSIIGLAPAVAGYQFPSFDAVSGAIGGLGWHVIGQTYNDAYAYVKVSKPAGAPDGADSDWWIYNGGNGISNYSARLAQRHAQTVTEAYALSVTAPASISANGTLVSSLRGALASDWMPDEWEADMSVTPDASAADLDHAPDATRAESDTAIETLLAIAKTRILASHRKARASFSIPCLPELDLVHAVELDTATLDCEGKVARLVHTLDLESGAAMTTVTVALSGIAAGGIVDETALDPPDVPDINVATGDDDWVAAIPHLASIHVGATDALSDPYAESLMGFLCNAPERASYYNFTLDSWYSVTNADYNEALAYPSTGFRASMPGVADTHRNPLTLDQSAAYDVDVPEDPLTLTA